MAHSNAMFYDFRAKTTKKIRAASSFSSSAVPTTDQKHYVEDATGRMAFPSGKQDFGKESP
jgi:hypothetical protein